jgi:hypothetical protein
MSTNQWMHTGSEGEKQHTFANNQTSSTQELLFGPEWMTKKSHHKSRSTPDSTGDAKELNGSRHQYTKTQLLELYKSSLQIPEDLRIFPWIISNQIQAPVAWSPFFPEEIVSEISC